MALSVKWRGLLAKWIKPKKSALSLIAAIAASIVRIPQIFTAGGIKRPLFGIVLDRCFSKNQDLEVNFQT
ncbi:hypothetical protein [Asticcacaulis sp.]|uniref:hypothetical protein n=1 Tax=Asticcacaulis sp. TaxID=1872648 RepID=UPI003F7BF31C